MHLVVEMLGSKKRRRARSNRRAKLVEQEPRKKAPKDPLWFPPIEVCGQHYRIGVFDDGRGYQGATTFADGVIEILEQAEDRMHDSLLHEVIHAMVDACGLKLVLRERFKLKDVKYIDEMIAVMLAPAILSTFRRAGWLKLPRKPSRVVHKKAASQAR